MTGHGRDLRRAIREPLRLFPGAEMPGLKSYPRKATWRQALWIVVPLLVLGGAMAAFVAVPGLFSLRSEPEDANSPSSETSSGSEVGISAPRTILKGGDPQFNTSSSPVEEVAISTPQAISESSDQPSDTSSSPVRGGSTSNPRAITESSDQPLDTSSSPVGGAAFSALRRIPENSDQQFDTYSPPVEGVAISTPRTSPATSDQPFVTSSSSSAAEELATDPVEVHGNGRFAARAYSGPTRRFARSIGSRFRAPSVASANPDAGQQLASRSHSPTSFNMGLVRQYYDLQQISVDDTPTDALSWDARINSEAPRSSCGPECPNIEADPEEIYEAVISLTHESSRFGARASDGIADELIAQDGEPIKLNLVPLFADKKLSPALNDKTYFGLTYDPAPGASRSAPARIPFSIRRSFNGCANIWVSVWNANMTRALDALVVSVAVGPRRLSDSSCRVDPQKRAGVTAGAAALLDLIPSGDQDASKTVGLHAFEFTTPGKVTETRAVVVARDQDGKPKVYGWKLRRTLTERFEQSDTLHRHLKSARKALDASSVLIRRRAYENAAEYLYTSLFKNHDDETYNSYAGEAYQAIQRALNDKEPGILVARFTRGGDSSGDSSFYLPLKMLSKASTDRLRDNFPLLLPVPGRTLEPDHCIARWNVAVSPGLLKTRPASGSHASRIYSQNQQAYRRILRLPITEWRTRPVIKIERLRRYLNGYLLQYPLPDGQAEGTILLGHHGSSSGFTFSEKGDPITAEDIRRRFRPNSVAVIAACSTTSPGAANGLVEMMTDRGVGTVVASPFQLSEAYAIRFVDGLSAEIDDAYLNDRTPTMLELFESTKMRVSLSYGADGSDDNFGPSQQSLELVIAGSPSIRLCRRSTTYGADR